MYFTNIKIKEINKNKAEKISETLSSSKTFGMPKPPPLLAEDKYMKNTETGIHQYAKRSHARNISSRKNKRKKEEMDRGIDIKNNGSIMDL
jgi:hypothetical protein